MNLGLRVVGRRPDGYHELESLFVPLDLADAVRVEIAHGPARVRLVETRGPFPVPPGAANLAVRAAQAFLDASGLPLDVALAIDKQVPVGAGLGGGSSDAGAVLRALRGFAPDALAPERLADLALALGADVPFFLDPRPSRVSGIGERIVPQPGVPALPLLLLNPGVALSTAEVFRAFDALAPGPPGPAAGKRATPAPDWSGDGPALRDLLANDLEPAAIRLCPAVRRLRASLESLAPLAVGLSGSGPTVFGVFPTRAAADAARQSLVLPPGSWARVAATQESR